MYNKLKKLIKLGSSFIKQPYFHSRHNKISNTSYIRFGVEMSYCTIGKYCYINTNTGLNCVEMGNYCSVAGLVIIGGMEHDINYISTSIKLSPAIESKTTHIGNDVWIGAQVYIKQGITIGNGAVIGANSFVNEDVPPYAIAVGSPARVIRYRFDHDTILKVEQSGYWNYPPEKAKEIISSLINK